MIKLFTSPTCAYCPTVKKWLDSKNIEYTVLDREENLDEFTEVSKISNQTTVPQLLLPNGKVIVGLNIPLMSKELL